MNEFDAFLLRKLEEIEQAGLRRALRVLESAQGAEVNVGGRVLLNFSSNDYLGLANHPSLARAAGEALESFGTGSGASRLICGTSRPHEELERAIARFKKTEAALSFSTGYAAAVGVIPAIVGSDDVVILDKLCHASLVDGARLSGATIRVFPHNNLEKLRSHLEWARREHPLSRVLVVVESVYSMDGDLAPLADIVSLKEHHGAWLMVDEAHGVGVLGAKGQGLADLLGLTDRIELQMGTLGKALGSAGAYLCGSAALRDYLINRSRSFIYSTAPPPYVAAAARAAVELLEAEEGQSLVTRLRDNIRQFAEESGCESPTAIFPIVIGDEREAVNAAAALLESGFLVPAIRYPTVSRGSARLRVVVTAAHTPEQISFLAKTLQELD